MIDVGTSMIKEIDCRDRERYYSVIDEGCETMSAVPVSQNNVGTDKKPRRYYSMYARNRACSDNAAKEERDAPR